MGALLFPGNDANLDISKAAFLEQLVQLHFAESEPVISVEFSRLFEAMAEQVEHHKAAAFFQNPVSGGDGAFWTDRVLTPSEVTTLYDWNNGGKAIGP